MPAKGRMGWFTALRVHQLRKAKWIRLDRFRLAVKAGDHTTATAHRKALADYIQRIESLTGRPEPVE